MELTNHHIEQLLNEGKTLALTFVGIGPLFRKYVFSNISEFKEKYEQLVKLAGKNEIKVLQMIPID